MSRPMISPLAGPTAGLLTALALAAVAPTQEPAREPAGEPDARRPLDGRAFVPPEPECEVWADFAAMRESGVWGGMTASIAATLLPLLEAELGFALEDVDRLRGYPPMGGGGDGEAPPAGPGVFVFEGNEGVITPFGRAGTKAEKIGGVEVIVVEDAWRGDDPVVWTSPREGTVVVGSRSRIAPVLLRQQKPGVTPPELLSLSAGRGVLAHFVARLEAEDGGGLVSMFAEAAGAEMVPPRYVMLRLRQVATDDEPEVHLDGVLRWERQGEEPARLAAFLREQLASLRKHPRWAALRRWWDAIELSVDDRDLRCHVVLGRPREAGAMVALLVPVMMYTTVRVEAGPAAAPPAVPVEEAEPLPVPAGGGKGKGKGKEPGGAGGG